MKTVAKKAPFLGQESTGANTQGPNLDRVRNSNRGFDKAIPVELRGLIEFLAELMAEEFFKENGIL